MDETAAAVPSRDKLILPALNSNNIYVFDVKTDPRQPILWKTIDGQVLRDHDVSFPHSTHCLADGNVMISTLGDGNDAAKGDFILFDQQFNCVGTWTKGERKAAYGYDFWYQPKFNVMVASEWSSPRLIKAGFSAQQVKKCGRSLNFYNWREQTLIQSLDLGEEGVTPLEIRFLHDPNVCEGYVGCGFFSKLYHFERKQPDSEEFVATKVVDIPVKALEGWQAPQTGGLMGDIVLSMDDRFLYLNNWLHGDVRQYDISDRKHPKLVGQVYLGGVAVSDSGVRVVNDPEGFAQPDPVVVRGKRLEGGPQMLQLSLDGKRLYVSSCLYSLWDKEVYPKSVGAGGYIVQLEVNTEAGGLRLNEEFLVDFAKEPYGPTMPHEIRYPGGDCTSDIFLAEE